MFTGIVQGQATLIENKGNDQLRHFRFRFPENSLADIVKGASIAINGTCLTVTGFDLSLNTADFDAIDETLRLTNLNKLTMGDKVNFERAARIGDEIGGHLMSGHIHTTITVLKIKKTPDNCRLNLQLPENVKPYILPKGFVGLNGCSLTIGDVSKDSFSIHLIPETLSRTTFGSLSAGDALNLELDSQTQTIVDTVQRLLNLQNS
jgi:riboflavin synthase